MGGNEVHLMYHYSLISLLLLVIRRYFPLFQKTLLHLKCCTCAVKTVTWLCTLPSCHQNWWAPPPLTCPIYWEWSRDRDAGLFKIFTYWRLHSLLNRGRWLLWSSSWMRLRRRITMARIRYCVHVFYALMIQKCGWSEKKGVFRKPQQLDQRDSNKSVIQLLQSVPIWALTLTSQ